MHLPSTARGATKPTVHGGDLGEVMRRYPDAPTPWIDLSTGINPVPYPIADVPSEAWSRLPSRAAGGCSGGALRRARSRDYRRGARHAGADPAPAAPGPTQQSGDRR